MPQYIYKCKECQKVEEVWHSMSDSRKDCSFCKSKNSLFKIPALEEKSFSLSKKQKVGSVVNRYIEETKEIVSKEKKELKEKQL